MRFMILVKASKDSEAGVMPTEDMLKAMADYHEQLAKAGVLLDGNGLHRVQGLAFTWSGGKRPDRRPLHRNKELVAGYTMIQVKSREEALEWTKRFPKPGIRGRRDRSPPDVRAGGFHARASHRPLPRDGQSASKK